MNRGLSRDISAVAVPRDARDVLADTRVVQEGCGVLWPWLLRVAPVSPVVIVSGNANSRTLL